MRTILIFGALILVVGGMLLWRTLRLPSEYGRFTGAAKIEATDLVDNPQQFQRKMLRVEGEVRDQCTSMGCYFFFRSGKKMLRVDLQEITMNAPRRNGRIARVEGQVVPFGDGYQFVASAVEFD